MVLDAIVAIILIASVLGQEAKSAGMGGLDGGGDAGEGVRMLLAYSLGLGVPFLLSAALIDRLKESFAIIKSHYGIINRVSGVFLILVGILMATGTMGRLLVLLTP